MEQKNRSLKQVVVECGNLSNGTILNLTNFDDKTVFVEQEFKSKASPNYILGEARCYLTQGKIMCDIDLYNDLDDCPHEDKDFDIMSAYPAISGRIIKSHKENKVEVVDEWELLSISLNSSPNGDPLIKSLKEQNEEIDTSS